MDSGDISVGQARSVVPGGETPGCARAAGAPARPVETP